MDDTFLPPQLKWALVAVGAVFGFMILAPFTIVGATERAVVLRFGVIDRTLDPGIHYMIPLVENVEKIDVSVQAISLSELAYSKDAQTLSVELVVNYQVEPSRVKDLYEKVRTDWESRYVLPRSKESLKNVLARYTAQGIIDTRGALQGDLIADLRAIEDEGIIIHDVSITNIDFDDAYENAVKEKQVQEQNALSQVNITKQEEEKKKQEILKAEALAEKTRLEVEALALSQGAVIIEKIKAEATLEAAKRWDGKLPVNMYAGAPLPLIQLGSE